MTDTALPNGALRSRGTGRPGDRPNRRLVQSTYAVVLAGGRGSRLKQLTDWRAKPAIPFGGEFKIIDFALSNCINSGIRRVGVLTQYKAQSLIRHVNHGWGFLDAGLGEFIDIVPAQQQIGESWYSGTANAVYQNLDMLRDTHPQHVLVLAGDHVYKMDYSRIVTAHAQGGADATVACTEVPLDRASAFGVVCVETDGRVSAFAEKPEHPVPMCDHPGSVLASMGIYVFKADFLYRELARDAADPHSRHDFGGDIIPRLVEQGCVVAHDFAQSCVQFDGVQPYWRDVGTLDAYWEANIDLTRPRPELDLYDDAWPIRGTHYQLPPAKFVFDEEGRRGTAIDSLVSSGCIVSGAAVRRSLLFSKARVGHGSVVEDSLLLPEVVVGRGVTLKRAIVDSHCVLPDGTRIGVDRDEDLARFTVTESGVTLVTPAMLGQEPHVNGN